MTAASLSQCNMTIFMQTAVVLWHPLYIITPHIPCSVPGEIAMKIAITNGQAYSILECQLLQLSSILTKTNQYSE